MMDAAFPAVALLAALAATLRSTGLGFVVACGVGYVNGVVRANYLGVFTTFMFDAGLLGFYAGFLLRAGAAGLLAGRGGVYAALLFGWPAALALVPVNDTLVQVVALRATVGFLPVLLIARRFTGADLAVVARGLAVLNLFALAAGVYVYQNGIEALFPQNVVTQLMYDSNDVAGNKHHRIPATFMNAHSYGGTMLFTLPFLLDRLLGAGVRWPDRALAAAGAVAAGAGVLMCAARQPVVTFGVAALVAWVVSRFHPTLGLVAAGVLAAGGVVAGTDERLGRATTLDQTDMVSDRLAQSANASFLELVAEYPLGAGMGSSVGTSVPFFLADRAPKPVGMENEFCRILIDQGWVGLGVWVAFLGWLFGRPPPARFAARWGLGVVLMYALTLTNWATAFLGTGTLSSIPMSVLLLAQMGVVLRLREPAAPPAAPGARP